MSTSGALSLSYKTYGDPHLPPLILLMGLGMPSEAWPRPFIDMLVQRGLYVVTPDNRDAGASPAGTGLVTSRELFFSIMRYVLGGRVTAPYTLIDMADDVLLLMDTLGYTLSTFLFLIAILKLARAGSWVKVAVISLICAVAFYVLFKVALGVMLPGGFLGF